jgi:SAM-dependent MidA family methyltransferase
LSNRSFSNIEEYLRDRIRTEGPLSFHDYMEAVLYQPGLGYYDSSKPRIGTEGDFYTSSDLDPIFGKLLARQFETWSAEFDDFTVVELGAGKGLLARDVLTQRRFRYLILERSPSMRAHQQSWLAGLDVEWIDELPANLNGCIFSNEFFDALPVHRFVGRSGSVKEIFVTEDFQEVELEPRVLMDFTLKEGQTIDMNLEARPWIRRIAKSLSRGFHIAIDYGYLRDEFFAQPHGTLMCYWRHQAHENPYVHVGEQDLTAHVNFSDLIDEGAAQGLRLLSLSSQKDFLIQRGILEEMQMLAVAGDAESMQRLLRMKNLIVPDRMGERFKVLIQERG